MRVAVLLAGRNHMHWRLHVTVSSRYARNYLRGSIEHQI